MFLSSIACLATGQGFLQTDGQAIVNENGDTVILRGMGLGGWMLQEGYMLQTADFANAQYQIKNKIEELIGEADTELFYEKWLENHVRQIDIDSLKSWGFNSVRLPMHYNLFTLPIEEEPVPGENTWLDKGFELTDNLIDWCKENEMYVILDLHAAPGGQGYDQGISDYDPTRPSLWESAENRAKTVALWKRIAEKYSDEPWVGGYDLINETNWDLPGGTMLRNLYGQITDAIREVDNNHVIFIEGNWFANDFTGLTPPWDDNMVYSPHKYWSTNDQGTIQWVLEMRDEHNVPLYFGECGENSNAWFRDAIKLFEDNGIGWAWWPMKKIEAIAGPLSIEKSTEYQTLLNYWNNGGTAPSAQFAKDALLDLTEQLKLENCTYQKDVIDAMFRQVQSDEAVPFNTQNIPGVVYASDFDMGIVGAAYFDTDVATYHVSTGNYTAWNNGWAYRNDGVDIERNNDNLNSNGYNVGWVKEGEWMQYDVDVATSAVYDVNVRIASGAPSGAFHFSAGEAPISDIVSTWNTGGWQNWNTFIVTDVVLTPEDKKLRFHIDEAEFNVSSFEFVEVGPTTAISTSFRSAVTHDLNTVAATVNKPLAGPIDGSVSDFEIFVDGESVEIINVELSSENPRIIFLNVDDIFKSSDIIKISYSGNEINATDGTALTSFSFEDVENTIPNVHFIPGRVEAEDFFFQQGVEIEMTTDVGGGENVGYLDAGDYMDYYISVPFTGIYDVNYRTAAESETGQIQLQIIDENGGGSILHTMNFPPTGGWQTWTTNNQTVWLESGVHHLRALITQPGFNMNWFEFISLTSTTRESQIAEVNVFPNPSADQFLVRGNLVENQNVEIRVQDMFGQMMKSKNLKNLSAFAETIDLSAFPNGNYFVTLILENGQVYSEKIVKLGN